MAIVVKKPSASSGDIRDMGLIPGLGRSSRKGNGYLLQYSCLGKSHGQRRLAGYSPWGHKRVRHNLATKTEQLKQLLCARHYSRY